MGNRSKNIECERNKGMREGENMLWVEGDPHGTAG